MNAWLRAGWGIVAVLALLFNASIAGALQQPRGVIGGVVVRAGGAPVASVQVSLKSNPEGRPMAVVQVIPTPAWPR